MPRKAKPFAAVLADNIAAYGQLSEKDCWVWTGVVHKTPLYLPTPMVCLGGRYLSARRVIHNSQFETLPTAIRLRAMCLNNLCVNPRHTNSPFLPQFRAEPETEVEVPEPPADDLVQEIVEVASDLPRNERNLEFLLAMEFGWPKEAILAALEALGGDFPYLAPAAPDNLSAGF